MISVLIASVIGFVWGSVWFMSPVGRAWRDAKPMDPKDDHSKYSNSPRYMTEMFGTGFVLTVATSYVLDVMFQIVGSVTLLEHLQLAWLLCFGFIITTKFNDLIYTNTPPFWGRRAQTVFLVDSGYYIVLYSILATLLYYLPW
jgi:uncharacterized membrane protein (Fun14 family)